MRHSWWKLCCFQPSMDCQLPNSHFWYHWQELSIRLKSQSHLTGAPTCCHSQVVKYSPLASDADTKGTLWDAPCSVFMRNTRLQCCHTFSWLCLGNKTARKKHYGTFTLVSWKPGACHTDAKGCLVHQYQTLKDCGKALVSDTLGVRPG